MSQIMNFTKYLVQWFVFMFDMFLPCQFAFYIQKIIMGEFRVTFSLLQRYE